MLVYMKRLTVTLADDLDREVRDEAVEAHLPRRRGSRRLLAAGIAGSGRSDVSVRIEEILGAELLG